MLKVKLHWMLQNLLNNSNVLQISDDDEEPDPKVLQPDKKSEDVPFQGDELGTEDVIDNPVVIEMLCETARVTACFKAIGLQDSFGVDRIKNKAISTMKIADLSTAKGQKLFLTWLDSPMFRGLFIAPPCGTCSWPEPFN